MLLFVADDAGRSIIEYATARHVHVYVCIYPIHGRYYTKVCYIDTKRCSPTDWYTSLLRNWEEVSFSYFISLFIYLLTSTRPPLTKQAAGRLTIWKFHKKSLISATFNRYELCLHYLQWFNDLSRRCTRSPSCKSTKLSVMLLTMMLTIIGPAPGCGRLTHGA